MCRALATSALTALATIGAGTVQAQSLPVGGTIASGSASIASNGATTTVSQSSDRAIVNWQSFDVGAGKGVVFVQPSAGAATLNRVTGGTGSTIAGSIRSNGAVYLVNPNGIAITSTGNVQTGGGFVASTLDIADADFNAGKLAFVGTGASKPVSNAGSITAGSGAYVALLGGSVSNAGTISVPLGKVGLGSGESITLDLSGDGFMQVAVPTSAITGGDTALVEMAGRIAAAGGRVELRAASVKDAVRNVINLTGTISADSAIGDGGSIVLLGGEGGTVVAHGTLSARATGTSGNGGSVETSGADVDFDGIVVDTRSAYGKTGTWLVDPTNLTVGTTAAATIGTNLGTGNVTLQTFASGAASGPGAQSNGNGDITINAAINWSSNNALTLNAYNAIAINQPITGSNNAVLTLIAGNAISQAQNASITVGTLTGSAGAGVNLSAGGNSIYTLGAFQSTGGPFTLVDGGAIALGLSGFLNVSGQSVNLTAYSIYNAAAGIAANTLTVNTQAGLYLVGSNNIGSIAGLSNSGISTGSYGVQIYNNGNLTIAGPVSLGVGSALAISTTGVLTWSAENIVDHDSVTLSGSNGIVLNSSISGSSVSFNSALTLGADVSVTNSVGAGSFGTINGAHALSVMGAATFGGAVGGSAPLASLSVSGTSAINGGAVTTSGAQTYTGAATLGADAALKSTAGTVGFGSTVNGAHALTVTGPATFGGVVGGSAPLTSLSVTGTSTISGGGVTTSGAQTYTGAATFAANTALTSTGGNIGFGSSATANGTYNLGVTAANINFAGNVTDAGTLTLATGGGTAYTGAITESGTVNVGVFNLTAGNWSQTGTLPSFSATDFRFAPTNATFLRVTGGAGTTSNPYTIADVYGLQGVASTTELSKSFVLTNAINASGTTSWNGGLGFLPIGTDGAGSVWNGTAFVAPSASVTGFSGVFNGNGLVLSGLAIARPSARFVGLFGLTTGTIANVTLTGGTVAGGRDTGALAGMELSGTVGNSSATTTVTGQDYTGGLVGAQWGGSLTGSNATGVVTGATDVGGLIGYQNDNAILNTSYATGAVTGTSYVGGLAGYEGKGTIANSYAMGAVNATGAVGGVGGLIGKLNGGVLTNSFSTGAVTAGARTISRGGIGGLIGYAVGATINNSYWDTTASGLSVSAGGIGETKAQLDAAALSKWDFTSIWTAPTNGGYPTLRTPGQTS